MNIISLWNGFYKSIMKVPFIFYLIVIALYFWVNGAAHFPNWNSTYGNLILPYIVMMLAFFMWAKARAETRVNIPSSVGIVGFVSGFIVTWLVMAVAISAGLFSVESIEPSLLLQTIILQICVIATAEELMFRGVILNMFPPKFGLWIQAIIFAVWHSYAYNVIWYDAELASMNIISLGIAFVFGIILGLVALRKEYGLPAAIGIHAAYNLAILGVLMI